MIGDDDLAVLQAVAADSLVDICTILRAPTTTTSAGNRPASTTPPDTIATDAPCRLGPVPARAGEDIVGGALQSQTHYILTLAVGTDIEVRDQVVKDGATYDVVTIDSGGSWQVELRCKVVERH